MAEELRCMAALCGPLGYPERAAYYTNKRDALIACIRAECWDARDAFYYSADVDIKTRAFDWFHKGLGVFWKTLPIRIRAWSGFIPMWAGFATPAEAGALVRQMFDKNLFATPYGITTLAMNEKMFDLSATNNPSNWLGPIWLVANYVAFSGLLRYGYRDEAEEICRRSLKLLADDLRSSGSLHEYYDPFAGRPVMNGGFINWNILALNMARELGE
jgi:putative isomerase